MANYSPAPRYMIAVFRHNYYTLCQASYEILRRLTKREMMYQELMQELDIDVSTLYIMVGRLYKAKLIRKRRIRVSVDGQRRWYTLLDARAVKYPERLGIKFIKPITVK